MAMDGLAHTVCTTAAGIRLAVSEYIVLHAQSSEIAAAIVRILLNTRNRVVAVNAGKHCYEERKANNNNSHAEGEGI